MERMLWIILRLQIRQPLQNFGQNGILSKAIEEEAAPRRLSPNVISRKTMSKLFLKPISSSSFLPSVSSGLILQGSGPAFLIRSCAAHRLAVER